VTTLPSSLVRFEHQLETAIRHDRRRQNRRVVLRSAISLAAVAAVALGVLGTVPRTGPSVVERAAAALRSTDGTILHTVLVGALTGPDGPIDLRIETWQASSPPHDQLQLITAAGRQFEVALADGLGQLYDPQTNTVYTGSSQLKDAQPVDKARGTKWKTGGAEAGDAGQDKGTIVAADDSYRAKILGLLESGKVHEDGRVAVDGRDAIRLVSDDGNVTLLVDADSYEPIEWRVSENGATAVTSFPTYERLPAGEANAALLSLTARHPDAIVDDDPAHYRAARWSASTRSSAETRRVRIRGQTLWA
jgi:hypothetical protein